MELRFKHVPDTVLSLEGTVRDPESDVGADQGVVRHDVSLVEPRLLLLESGEHLRDLIWDPPGQREFLGGRKDVVYAVVAISQESTGCTAEEECLRARVECADQGLQALCGCDKGTGIHAWSLIAESACSIGLRLAALSLTRRTGTYALGCDWMLKVRTSFDASAVAFERDDNLGAEWLVLAEHPDGTGRRLEVQRPLQVDEQDLALGHDTYCLVTEEQATHYGGVLDWQIEESTLHLDLTEEASRAIGASRFRITLPKSECATVQAALESLLA